jgi:hypothetical protein
MSQHYYRTSYDANGQARPVEIMAGFDRPLQGFFCVVSFLDQQDDDDSDDESSGYLYSNLEDSALARSMGMSQCLTYFATKLAEFGLDLPPAMYAEIFKDEQRNVGNRYVRYGADGLPVEPAANAAAA